MAKRFSHQRVKQHRDYTLREASDVTGAHPQTIIRWIKSGSLPALTEKRPWLIAGLDLKAFLGARTQNIRQRMAPYQFFCLSCKCPRDAALKMADYRQTHATSGQLTALCAVCDTIMYKAIRRADLEVIRAKIDVTIQREAVTLVSRSSPPSKVTFSTEAPTHVKSQS